jgi:hypothetical protein
MLVKPPAQLGNQSHFKPAVHVAITLVRDQSRKALQMRADGADLQTLQVFSLGIKTSIHKCHSFLFG